MPENLVSRDGFSRPVPRQPAHLQTEKIHNNGKETKHKMKNNEQTDSTCEKTFLVSEKVMVHCDRPRSNCFLCSVEAVSRCYQPICSLANSSRLPACTFKVVVLLLSSILTSDWNRILSCSGPVKFKLKNSAILEEGLLPPPLLMSQPAILRVRPTQYHCGRPSRRSGFLRPRIDRGASRQWITLWWCGLRKNDFHP